MSYEQLSTPAESVLKSMDLIEELTSPLNSSNLYRYNNEQPYHSSEITYQSMIELPNGELWRAIKIENNCGGGIVTTSYQFAKNEEWVNGVRRIILDPVYNNIIDETDRVKKDGTFEVISVARYSKTNEIDALINDLGIMHADLVEKSSQDILFTLPERQQMYELGHPDFKYVKNLKKAAKKLSKVIFY